jgi:hypothetical protein
VNYREAYGIYACNGILFNHESPIRGETFVTRKITRALARIKLGLQDCVYLGNLDAKRDWGYAKDYVDGMWRMLQAKVPDSYVLATGRTETVRDFVRMAFKAVGVELEFRGQGEQEVGADTASGKTLVRVNPRFYRPAEVKLLIGSPEKAKKISEAKKAKQRKMSDETKGKLSEAKKGKKLTEEHKQSISQGLLKGKEKKVPERLSEEELYESRMQCQTKAREALRGSKRYNNGIKEISAKEHPGEGWVIGRLPRTAEYTENHKKKCSAARKDTFVVNDGVKNLYIKTGTPIPEGFVIGMVPRKSSK